MAPGEKNLFDSLRGSTCAVTGGAGFIGSHVVRALLKLSVGEVRVIDSFVTSRKDGLQGSGDTRLKVIDCDIGVSSIRELENAMDGVDYLFHLAAWKLHTNPQAFSELLRRNIEGTALLFDCSARLGIKQVVFSSSLYAYGRSEGGALSEDEPAQPRTAYGISKLAGEHLCAMLNARHDIGTAILRYFFVYGPGQYTGLGYPSVIVKNFQRMRRGQAPLICGDGEQRLDYVFVDDVVHATLLAATASKTVAPVNIGSGNSVSILELTREMSEIAGVALSPEHCAADWTAGTVREAAISRASEILRWVPHTDLKSGLEKTWSWICQQPVQ